MKPLTVRQLRDALDDLITRRPVAADHPVILVKNVDAGLTEVRPDFELHMTVLVADGAMTSQKVNDDTADTADRTRK